MSNFIDFKKYLQNELGDSFEVTDELNNDYFLFDKTAVVVRTLAGNVYDDSAQVPYQIEIYTDEPKEMIDYFTTFAKNHNNKFIDSIIQENDEYKKYTILQSYTTPVVLQTDIEFGSRHFSKVVLFPTLFIMFNVRNVKSIKINDELQETINGSINYTTELYSSRISGQNLNIQNKKTSTTQLTFLMLNKSTIFGNQVSQIRQGKLSGNTKFNVEVVFNDDSVENYSMILQTASLSFARAALSTLNITMILARNE